ncbi:MAG: 3-phosphoglycerate dehydrogenase family protein [Lachnospirales bacterium]
MYKIRTLNKISPLGLSNFSDKYEIDDNITEPDGIILRSYKMNEIDITKKLVAIGRAGAGVNNIPIKACSEKGVVVFNTPGANANAVKELVLTGLFLASRKIVEGINWVENQSNDENISATVEKEKSNYIGPEIYGKTIGVIGLGAIGILVANAARDLGMNVVGYDPYLSVENALKLKKIKLRDDIESVFAESDYVSVHIPLNDSTKNIINSSIFGKAKKGIRLLNLARGGIVKEDDVIEALKDGTVSKYVTDFPNKNTIGVENIINIPHLGASTPESEENCAVMAVNQVKRYIETGDIINSVNYPNCQLPRSTENRICVLHENVPNVLGSITTILGKDNINVDELVNKSRGELAYTILDVDAKCQNSTLDAINSLEHVYRVREI